MNPEIVEISIITLAFGVVLGYTIGIVKHLADNDWRLDSMDLF